MSNPQRLHPVAALITFLKLLKELLFPILFFLLFGPGSGGGRFEFYYYLGFVILLFVLLIIGIASWARYTYRIDAGELRIEYGIFIKKKRYIPLERIQSISLSQGLVQRFFRLSKVQVETAGGGAQAEAVLTAVRTETAEELQRVLVLKREVEMAAEAAEAELVDISYSLSWQNLLIAASTSGGVGVVLSAMAAFSAQFDEWIPDDLFVQIVDWFIGAEVVILILAIVGVLLLTWLLAITGTVLRYANFNVTKRNEELIIRRGLVEKSVITIPVQRVQAIRIVEGMLRQPFGYVAVYVESAGGSSGKEENFSTTLFPLLKKQELASFLHALVPEFAASPVYVSAPKRALPRYLLRSTAPVLAAALPLIILFRPFGWGALILVVAAGFYGYSSWKAAGWQRENDFLYVQYRRLGKTALFVPKRRLQAMEVSQNVFQARKTLGSLQISILSSMSGKHFAVADLNEHDVLKLLDWFSNEKPAFIEKDVLNN